MKSLPVLIILVVPFISCQQKERTLEDTMQKSVRWIWAQQDGDGGWHSQTHAVLRDGIVLTPYILYQLSASHHDPDKRSVDKAVDFITQSMRSSLSADSTTLLDYPNYSAAYALRVLHLLGKDTSLQKIIANYLIAQQFTERRGFTPDSIAYGGWGYGEPDLKMGDHGHEDLSHTRRITQALVESGYLPDSLKSRIMLFLKGAQRDPDDPRKYEGCISRRDLPYDGGFVSSVATLPTNKSVPVYLEHAGYHYPSYATATCDGFLTLAALGMKSKPAYEDAASWLLKNQHYSTIDGLSVHDPEQWTYIMHYYHLSVQSEAMAIINPGGAWRDSISQMLIKEQLPDGEYINGLGGINKEDDPLVSTVFCIEAASRIVRE